MSSPFISSAILYFRSTCTCSENRGLGDILWGKLVVHMLDWFRHCQMLLNDNITTYVLLIIFQLAKSQPSKSVPRTAVPSLYILQVALNTIPPFIGSHWTALRALSSALQCIMDGAKVRNPSQGNCQAWTQTRI